MKRLYFQMFPQSDRVSAPRSHVATSRGFTLVELLVALTVGLSVSMAAFVLAKNSTRVFQNEARITGAQLGLTLGMNRIAADLQRAGFLSSANMQPRVPCQNGMCDPGKYNPPDNADPFYCPAVGAKVDWPEGLKKLAGLTIQKHDTANGDLTQSNANGFDPEMLTIGGSFTNERFAAKLMDKGLSGNRDIRIERYTGPYERTRQTATDGNQVWSRVFQEGRFLRVEDVQKGYIQYGVISGVDVSADNPPIVTVRLNTYPKIYGPKDGQLCGIEGFGDLFVNPITRIRYDIRSLKGHINYGGLVQEVTPELTGDDGRTELVRVELDEADQEIPDTLELVTEYAVDLRFGITVLTKDPIPLIQRFPIAEPTSTEVLERAGVPGGDTAQPETIRAVQVRLTTRARTPDRETDMGDFEDAGDGRRYRFRIGTVQSDTRYARLRTHYADIALPNTAGVTW